MADILDRIQKLLKLAGNAGSEAEAALASSRARALMVEHEITDAELRAADPNARPAEPIDKLQATETSKRVGWHWFIAVAVAESYNVKTHWGNSGKKNWDNGSIYFFGRLSSTQAARYTTLYLIREVELLCQTVVKQIKSQGTGSPSKSWTNAFRIGASRRVAGMVLTQGLPGGSVAAYVAANRGNAVAVDGIVEDIVMTPPPDVSPSEGAMVLIQRERKEVDDAYVEYTRDWKGSLSSVGASRNGDGYAAGNHAARSIRISGARGALKRGTEVLP